MQPFLFFHFIFAAVTAGTSVSPPPPRKEEDKKKYALVESGPTSVTNSRMPTSCKFNYFLEKNFEIQLFYNQNFTSCNHFYFFIFFLQL